MPDQTTSLPALAAHGALCLPAVEIDSYNLELKDGAGGFVGDRACKGAFREILDQWREPLRRHGDDPFGDEPTEQIGKKTLDALLAEGHPEAAGALQGAIEDFSHELAIVIRRFLKLKQWGGTERIVIGGGFSGRRIGELAIGRTSVLLKAEGIGIEVVPIRHAPDEAGLIGAVHLAPSWLFKGFDGILAVDIGGTNIRAGVVRLNLGKARDLAKAAVWKFEVWRHGEEDEVSREDAVDQLCKMLRKLIGRAEKEKLALAPFIGIGCPGRISEDGSIERGAQNLPGNWESSRFNLPSILRKAIPEIGDHETVIRMHNDAVVQGLSEVPFMRDVARWGVLTIGTGLGNARFTNRDRGDH